jgi:D-beta-D-heptose 7-phosphate kinase/D-beta-D-heptose 1-phosphate adenosyltransferase
MAAGASLAEAAQLANHAAGIVVGRFGPATVSPAELLEAFPEHGTRA